MLDAHGCEFIFQQPATYYELFCVVNAAAVEVQDSYSCKWQRPLDHRSLPSLVAQPRAFTADFARGELRQAE
jgi:hypothetical protein